MAKMDFYCHSSHIFGRQTKPGPPLCWLLPKHPTYWHSGRTSADALWYLAAALATNPLILSAGRSKWWWQRRSLQLPIYFTSKSVKCLNKAFTFCPPPPPACLHSTDKPILKERTPPPPPPNHVNQSSTRKPRRTRGNRGTLNRNISINAMEISHMEALKVYHDNFVCQHQ